MSTLRRDHRIEGGLGSAEERRADIERLARKLRNHSSRVRACAIEQLLEYGDEAVPPLCQALYLSDSDVQVAAAKGLGELRNRRAVDPLMGALGSRNIAMRSAAASALGEIGDPAAEGLLRELLNDADLSVRAAAARALGALGLEESIPALMAAYWACFVGQSARTQRLIGLGMVLVGLLLFVLIFWGATGAKISGICAALNLAHQIPSIYFRARRAKSAVACAITEALVMIAERNPRPEMHRLVPELRAVAGDRLQHEKATRKASRLAAERIEALTAAFHDLPVAAGAPAPDPSTLPHPAEAPQQTLGRRGS